MRWYEPWFDWAEFDWSLFWLVGTFPVAMIVLGLLIVTGVVR